MAERYLVTGGAGFIGSNLTFHLLEQGKFVRVLDNLSTGKKENLAKVMADIDFVQGDIRDMATVKNCTQGIDYVLHQAAIPSVPRSIEDPLFSNDNNITGTLNILIACRDNQVQRVVFASSSSVYGDTPVLPKTEEMPAALLSPYALNKLTGEYYAKIFSSVFELETISLRYFNVFGPHQDPASEYAAVIPKFIQAFIAGQSPTIYGDGEQTRDFTFVDNVIYANILATQVPKTTGEIVNIATGHRISLNELLDHLKKITGKQISAQYTDARIGDVRHSLADITRAQNFLGYQPTIDFHQGLKQTFEWFQSHNF